jgi:hypothetical protein
MAAIRSPRYQLLDSTRTGVKLDSLQRAASALGLALKISFEAPPRRSAAARTRATSEPKLLLDANVFYDLAVGRLDRYKDRLLKIAKLRNPPLLWAAPITFEEIASRLKAERFGYIRDVLEWMERLFWKRRDR